MSKSIAIIGAGVAGLSAGCYARMNGYETTIFELHNQPGGLCTSWQRGDYTFDGCVHWLVGTSPTGSMHHIWQELGALKGKQIVNHEVYMCYESADGRRLNLYTNADRLEQHLLELAPEDAAISKELAGVIRKLSYIDQMPDNAGILSGLSKLGRMIPALLALSKYSKYSMMEFAERFTNPFLREAFAHLDMGLDDFPILGLVFPLAFMHAGDAGYPVGGSLSLARAIEQRYLELGGKIRYKSRVEKIITENGRAVGVVLADKSEQRADYIISAADGYSTIFKMLDGKYINEEIRSYYEGGLKPFPSLVQVSLGIGRDLSGQPKMVIRPLSTPLVVGTKKHHTIPFAHYSYDPTMAPPGKSVVITILSTDYQYWKDLYADKEKYKAEKERIAAEVIAALDEYCPGIKEQVELVDVASPVTFERYTANWQASFEGWLLTKNTLSLVLKGLPKTLPGLDNFFMIGQWTVIGGGLPPAARDGRDIISRICKQDGVKFTTTK